MVAITSLISVVATLAAFAMPLGVNGETSEVSQIQKDINALSKNMVSRFSLKEDVYLFTWWLSRDF